MCAPLHVMTDDLKKLFLLLVFMLLSANLISQQSSLTVNAKTAENQNASGVFILSDNAIQDSTWKTPLLNGTAYFPIYTVGIEDNYINEYISIFPNPVGRNSDVRIKINQEYQLKAIRVYDFTGRVIYIGEPQLDEFSLTSCKGMLLLQFQDVHGAFSTKKLVSIADNLSFKLETEITGKKKSAQAESYTLTFEDLVPEDPEFTDYSEQISIGESEHVVMDLMLEYSLKNIVIQGITSPDARGDVKTNTETLGSLEIDSQGNIEQQTFRHAFSKNGSLPIVIELSDDNADKLSVMRNAEHNQPIEINALLTYNYGLVGASCSPSSAVVEVYNDSEFIGTDVINDAGVFQINWKAETKSMQVDSIRVSMDSYYPDVQTNVALTSGSNPWQVSLEAITYQYSLSGSQTSPTGTLVRVYDKGIQLGSTSVDANGDYSITWESQSQTMIADSIVFSSNGYVSEVYSDYLLSAGTNVLETNLVLSNYNYVLSGTETSPIGTQVRVYDMGLLLGSAVVDANNDYSCSWWSSVADIVVDSIVFSASGYVSEVFKDYGLTAGQQNLEASLEEAVYQYNLSGTACSPAGTLVQVFDDSNLLGSANVSNAGVYNISWENQTVSMVIDSIVFTSDGYFPQVFSEYLISMGTTVLDASLELILFQYALQSTECSPEGTVVKVYSANQLLGSASVDNQGDYLLEWTSTENSMLLDSIVFSADGYVTEVIADYSASAGTITLDASLELATYQYTLQGTETSPVGTSVSVYQNGQILGSDVVNAQGDYSIGWSSIETTMVIDSIVFSASGYFPETFVNYTTQTGTTVLNASLDLVTYQYTLQGTETSPVGTDIRAYNGGLQLGSAVVDAQGDYACSWSGAASAMTIDSIVFLASGYVSQVFRNFDISHGVQILNASLELAVFQYNLQGFETSPVGTTVSVYENGQILGSATVNSQGDYSINWESQEASMDIDSIVFSATGYMPKRYIDYNIATGQQTIEASLDLVKYEYTLLGTETSPVGTDVRVYDLGQILGSAVVNSSGDYSLSWENQSPNMLVDSIVFSASGFQSMVFNDYGTASGQQTLNAELIKPYSVTINLSNDDGKTEQSFRGYVLSGTDTISVADFTGTTGQLQFSSTEGSLDVIVGARNIPYFTGSEVAATLTGNNTVSIDTEARGYTSEVTVHVSDSDQGNSSGALVEIAGQSGNTDANGNISITLPLISNANNQFIAYQETITTNTGNNSHDFSEITSVVTMQVGTMPTVEHVVSYINEFFVYSTASTDGMAIRIWKNNAIQSQTTSDGLGDYSTPVITSNELTYTPDSIVFSKLGKVSQTISPTLNDGGDVLDVELTDIPTSIVLEIGVADHRADNWLTTGTYHIRTSDGVDHAFGISSGVQSFTIEGSYEATEPIKVWVEDISDYEDLVHTIVADYQQPIASNGCRDDTLTTTLEALDGGVKYDLVMQTSVYDDADFRIMVGGGREWNGQVNGHRGMTRVIVTQRASDLVQTGPDAWEYVYTDDLTTDELNALRERSALFDQGFMNRGIGYVIMESLEQEVETVLSSNYAKARIMYNLTIDSRNYHSGSGDTYYYGSCSVQDWMNVITLSTEWFEAVAWPATTHTSGVVGHTGPTPYLTSLGEDVATVNFTYKGGQAPRE
jgi:hypothetical protein